MNPRRRRLRLFLFRARQQPQRQREHEKNAHKDAQPLDDRAHIDIGLARQVQGDLHQLANAPTTPAASPLGIVPLATIAGVVTRSRTPNPSCSAVSPSTRRNSSDPPGPHAINNLRRCMECVLEIGSRYGYALCQLFVMQLLVHR